jgi:CRP/FNR family transcriptional regulator, cyclic AMP receptor protein
MSDDWNRPSDRDWAKTLEELPLFAGLGRRRLRHVAQAAQFAEFAPGETVMWTGEPSDSFYVILSGEAKARWKDAARTLGAGDYFGEMGLLAGDRRSATIEAVSALHVMRLSRSTFFELLGEDGVALRIMSELGERVRRAEQAQA